MSKKINSSRSKNNGDSANDDDDHDRDICTIETPFKTLKILEDLSSSDNDNNKDDDAAAAAADYDDDSGLEDSIGRFVWPTAVPLLRYLLSSDNTRESNNCITFSSRPMIIVELGAGCGVLGMGLAAAAAAAAAKAKAADKNNSFAHVILTDHDSDWLERNVSLNMDALSVDDTTTTKTTTTEVVRLDWRNQQDIERVQTMIGKYARSLRNTTAATFTICEEEYSNNNNNNASSREEQVLLLLIGSDILYNHSSHEMLASTLYQLVQQPQQQQQQTQHHHDRSYYYNCRIVLGFPDRDNRDEEHFLPILQTFFDNEENIEVVVKPSRPIDEMYQKRNKKGKAMDLRVIDFCVS